MSADIVNRDAVPPEGDFYVTVRDAGRTGFLLGPYADLPNGNTVGEWEAM